MNACSCLTLILACIVYWQAREISRLAAAPDFPFDPDLLRHVSDSIPPLRVSRLSATAEPVRRLPPPPNPDCSNPPFRPAA